MNTRSILSSRLWALQGTLAICAVTAARAPAQGEFAPISLDSFEAPAGITSWTPVSPPPFSDGIYLRHEASTIGATQGVQSLLVEVEGDDYLCDECFQGFLSGSAVKREFVPADAAQYAALTAAVASPQGWSIEVDVTTTAESWAAAPPSTSLPSRVRIGVGLLDGAQAGAPTFGSGLVTSPNLYGAVGTRRLSFPLSGVIDFAIPPNPSSYALFLGGFNTFPRSDPTTGALLYFDNIRLRPSYPQVNEVVWDFESDDATFQGWSDAGISGVSTSHKHHIVTGFGATSVTVYGDVTPDPAGRALLIDTSRIPPGVNGFQWGSAMTLNADLNNDGAIDDAAAKTEISDLVAHMRRSDAVRFDVTFHDALAPPAGLPSPQVLGEPNAPWLKIVLGIWTDPTPGNGAANGPLDQFQHDNEFAVDLLGNYVQISRGDIAALLTTEPSPDIPFPAEPLTMTMPFGGMGNLVSALQSGEFDASNFLRFAFAIQTSEGSSSILATIDNIRFVATPPLEADFDYDGDVDSDDLTEWHDSFGARTGADADGDLDVDGADLLVWQRQLGNRLPDALGAAAVPEPPALFVALAALLPRLTSRAWRQTRSVRQRTTPSSS